MLQTLGFLATIGLLAAGMGAAPASVDDEPEGEHFNLNLIGLETTSPVPPTAGGQRIFVPLYGECRIDLSEGEFGVADPNCTDDGASEFTLPNPDPEDDGVSSYRIYVRALGQPGGEATFTTCREDADGTWCSTENVYVARAAGQSPSMDVSRTLLTVCHDRDGDGTYEREQIFDDENAGYYWNYSNDGLRLAQLRFYPNTPTDISGPCPAV